jgi:parvulin-like peptidyl-prolyl cis-trans isomerase-like protein
MPPRRPPTLHAPALPLALLVSLGALSARGDSTVVATVGSERIDAAELSERARHLADFQLIELGASWPEQRRRLLDDVLVREALLAQAAGRARLGEDPYVGWRKDQLLAGALLAALTQAALAAVKEAEIAAYYAAHQADYVTPRGIEIWRLLVADEASARASIERARTLDPSGWSQLVRESSLDSATRMRSGSLGFVRADGHTNRPDVRVAPQLFAAANKVGDGQLVLTPVPEGEQFAVVWRRKSRAAETQKLAEVRDTIRALLAEQRVALESARLLEELRRARVSEYHPELSEGLSLAEEKVRPRPESPGVAARSVDPRPQPSERGLR